MLNAKSQLLPSTRRGGGQIKPVAFERLPLREVSRDCKKDDFMPVFKNGKKEGPGPCKQVGDWDWPARVYKWRNRA